MADAAVEAERADDVADESPGGTTLHGQDDVVRDVGLYRTTGKSPVGVAWWVPVCSLSRVGPLSVSLSRPVPRPSELQALNQAPFLPMVLSLGHNPSHKQSTI